MAYNTITGRGTPTNGTNLVPVEYADKILQSASETSAAMQLFQKYDMGSYTERIPVLDALPQASFVNGEATAYPTSLGLKQTTSQAWAGRILTAETIATIVVVPKQLLADSMFDVFAQVQPKVSEAIGRALDAAVFFGQGAPASFPPALVPASIAAGLTTVQGTNNAAAGGLEQDFAALYGLIENQGFEVDGLVANTTLRAAIRGARTTYGQPVDPANFNPNEIYDVPVKYALKGLWPSGGSFTGGSTTSGSANVTMTSTAGLGVSDAITGTGIPANTTVTTVTDATHAVLSNNSTATGSGLTFTVVQPVALAGDFDNGILGVRQDITYQMLTEATLFDQTGAPTISLAQSNAVGLLVEARFGFQVANWVTWQAQIESQRYPFATLLS